MLDDRKKEFEQIRQAIADGQRDWAIQLLSNRLSGDDPLNDSLILLETRLSNLQQSVIEGVISREDENIERNSISKGLLQLVKALEAREENPPPTSKQASVLAPDLPKPSSISSADPSEKHTKGKIPFNFRHIALVAGLLLTIAGLWSLGNWASAPRTHATPILHDVNLHLVVMPSIIQVETLGKVQIQFGDYTSQPIQVPADGILLFKNTPIRIEKDSFSLRLTDLKYKHQIIRQSSDVHKAVLYHIILKTNTYSGKVLRPDLRPAAQVELEIENGLVRTITDDAGNFSFILPEWGASTVQLTMRKAGKVLVSKKVGLSTAVFKELKIPN